MTGKPRAGVTIPYLTYPRAGIKRTSPESDASTRPSKVSKTGASQSTKKASKKGRKRGIKVRLLIGCFNALTISLRLAIKLQPSISAEKFNSTASPLHVNLTHTESTTADSETEVDPGFIGNVTLAPSTFSTGSFGWKGSKRITVELPSSSGDEKENVQVMLTINATVVGSKPAQFQAAQTNDAVEEEESDNKSKDH
ncbi:hypothetical protein C0995_016480 [Termitomyces sp. Mi166|nr:hypothetical protein C0995_016480 [Termitomyces sp. Mi166\